MLLRILHSAIFYLLLTLTFSMGTVLAHAVVLFSKSETQTFRNAARIWARLMLFCAGIRIKTAGLENIPRDGGVIFASNHQSGMDILLLLGYLPKNFAFAVKKELFKVPIYGWSMKRAKYFSINRETATSAYRTLEKIIGAVQQNDSVLIFPEGTRSKTGELGKFRRGSLLVALKAGAPILPVAISGSFNIIPWGTWLIHPHPVKLSVGKPISIKSEASYKDKLEEVRAAISKML